MKFPRFNGAIAAAPLPDSPLAYNEDTIVNLILQILNLLTRICHIKPGELVYPSPSESSGGTSRHQDLDLTLCNTELILSPRVTSLLGRIPYFIPDLGSGPQIAFGSFLPNYLDAAVLHASRRVGGRPPWLGDAEVPGEPLRPVDVILTYGIDLDDMDEMWILDTAANTIRRCCPSNGCPSLDAFRRAFPNYQAELPDEPESYRNAPALHAPTVLASYIEDLRSLLFLPEWEMNWREVCFALIEDYGWGGDAFREEDWARDRMVVWEEIDKWSYETYGDDQTGFEPPAVRYLPPWV
ncbi:hypothetical protein N0V93_005975 [Gnomoniopsis smithogilvyi]|uniref:Uncharacterized protein n=1 Tax=Gnomoniopsis smithogilvyi TaxID=1191159 RepID=A0A9W8YUA9_9PEZI|nr:hypothetical protein N0V93_005975 [Gnomoniopsis smithogilvyi]